MFLHKICKIAKSIINLASHDLSIFSKSMKNVFWTLWRLLIDQLHFCVQIDSNFQEG